MLTIKLDQEGDGKEYQAALRGADVLPSGENVRVITTSKGTVGGQAAVLVTFPVVLPNGSIKQAQYTFTAKEFLGAAEAVRGAHPQTAEDVHPTEKPGTVIRKFHRGVAWTALSVEKAYLINVEGHSGFSIAFNDDEMRKMGPLAVDKALGLI